jgi:hypothetical protein
MPDAGKPYYVARTSIDTLTLIETPEGWDNGSNSLRWWTRTQSIRTVAEMPLEAALIGTGRPPVYQVIARKAKQLHDLGLSHSAIARRLGVSDKTVCKAINLGQTFGSSFSP